MATGPRWHPAKEFPWQTYESSGLKAVDLIAWAESLVPNDGNTVDRLTETVFTKDMTTTQTTAQTTDPRCATCNQPYGHCYEKGHDWTPRPEDIERQRQEDAQR